jgi:hypothetical protein
MSSLVKAAQAFSDSETCSKDINTTVTKCYMSLSPPVLEEIMYVNPTLAPLNWGQHGGEKMRKEIRQAVNSASTPGKVELKRQQWN